MVPLKLKHLILKFKNYSQYDDENLWDYVSNKKLLDNIDGLLNEKSYFVHDLGLLDPGSNPKMKLVGIETIRVELLG